MTAVDARTKAPAASPPAVLRRDPRERLAALFAPGELELLPAPDAEERSGVLAACGRVHGTSVVAFASDPRVQGGAMGSAGCSAIVAAYSEGTSGGVPQIAGVLGPAAGGAAYGPALTDIVILSGAGRIFVTGPDVVRSVTGEDVDAARLGGPEPHSRRSGVVHLVTETDAAALDRAREVAALL